MSRRYSSFPFGNPPDDTDRFLVGRVDGASPTGFSNFIMTWAELKAAIGAVEPPSSSSSAAGMVLGLDAEETEEPMFIPGAKGDKGDAGVAGIAGRDGAVILPDSPDDPEEPMMIPGPSGVAAGGSGYNTIEDDGTPQTQRTTINFTGAGVTASDVGGETQVSIPGGAGGDLALNKHILTSNFTITDGYAAYITRYLELAAGVILEIGADGDLEIG